MALINRRIELVAQMHAHKQKNGYNTVDPDRERLLLEHLEQSSEGPSLQRRAAAAVRDGDPAMHGRGRP